MASNTLPSETLTQIMQKAFDFCYVKYPVLSAFASDCSDATAKYGDTISVRAVTALTVNNFGTGATNQVFTAYPVTINAHKEIALELSVTEYSSTDFRLIDDHAQALGSAIGKHMFDTVAALITTSNFTNTPLDVASGWNRSNTTLPMFGKMDVAGVPDNGRFFLTNNSVYRALLGDSAITAPLYNSGAGGAVTTAVLPNVDGFQGVYNCPSLPNTGNLIGFAGTKDTLLYATRLQSDPSSQIAGISYPGIYRPYTDAKTGMSVLLNCWIAPADNKINYRVSWMYGVAKGRVANGFMMRTSA